MSLFLANEDMVTFYLISGVNISNLETGVLTNTGSTSKEIDEESNMRKGPSTSATGPMDAMGELC